MQARTEPHLFTLMETVGRAECTCGRWHVKFVSGSEREKVDAMNAHARHFLQEASVGLAIQFTI